MKTRILIPTLALLIIAATAVKAQDNPPEYLGLPGDNLNLYAVMKLFQESKTLESFEKNLNDPKNKINNLDINGDNYVDYIMVVDNVRGNVHNIVLRVAVNRNENQDVAVFTVERFSDGEVQIQLTGDPLLYGNNYIIEPNYADNNGTPNPGYTGDNEVVYGRKVVVVHTTPFITATWPLIRYIYTPDYIAWHSAWYWDYYPGWWHPWRPFYWNYYYGYHYNWYNDYYCCYRRWNTHRYSHWDDHYYFGTRVYSPYVAVNISNGHYRKTYEHPETRKDGELAYHRDQPETGRRSTYSTVTANSRNGEGRNQNINSGRKVTSSNITTTRRNDEGVSRGNAKDYRTLKDADAGNTRRMASTVTSRAMSENRPSQNTMSSNRVTTQNNSRTLGDYRPSGNAGSNGRSSYQPAGKSESKPVLNRNVNSGHSSGQVKSESVSSAHRSSGNANQGKVAGKSKEPQESESKNGSRRK